MILPWAILYLRGHTRYVQDYLFMQTLFQRGEAQAVQQDQELTRLEKKRRYLKRT